MQKEEEKEKKKIGRDQRRAKVKVIRSRRNELQTRTDLNKLTK